MDIGPISLFDCVKSNQPSDCVNLNFDEFVSLMEQYAADEFARKNDAPLICLTEFAGGRRSKANATRSGMVVLDIDDHLSVEDVDAAIREVGVSALLCSTASHRPSLHKFRVFVPLLETASYDQHVLAWHVVNHALADGKADPSKIGCESMFFVAGQYPDAPSVFRTYHGYSLSAEDWITLVGSEQDVLALSGKSNNNSKETFIAKPRPANKASQHLADADLDLTRTKLVTDAALDRYRHPSGAYHHARFALLMSMAGRASRMNLDPTVDDLVALFNQVDLEDGGHYQSQEYQQALRAEAAKALTTS